MDPRRPLSSRPAPSTFAELAKEVLAAPARLGSTRLVCIDGPAGSGKTTFAARLAAAVGTEATVVHLEDLYAGWTLTGAVARLCAGVLRPVAVGVPGAFHRYDWHAARFERDPIPVPCTGVLIVEGCGSSPRALDPWTSLRVWIEAPAALREERGLARDGADTAPLWRAWQTTEAAEFAAEGTRDRADLRVDGARPGPLPDDAFVPLDASSPLG